MPRMIDDTEVLVSLRNVSKAFGPLTVLDDISIDIPKGKFVSILGPSGCGKSTLLAIMGGLETPTKGQVEVFGAPLIGANTRCGMVFQKDLLLDWKTTFENIEMQFKMRGQPAKPHKARIHELLELVGLSGFSDAYPRELSGGMRQRVSLCRALAHDPALLLMDEPFGALDAITREQVASDLARLTTTSGKTTIFVTHSLEEAVFLGDVVYVLSARPGRIFQRIDIDIAREAREWPRGESVFTPYVEAAFEALNNAGAYDNDTE